MRATTPLWFTLALATAVLIGGGRAFAYETTLDLEADPTQLEITAHDRGLSVRYQGATPGTPGSPDLPVILRRIELEPGATIRSLDVEILSSTLLEPGQPRLAPADRRAGDPAETPRGASLAQLTALPVAQVAHEGAMRGRTLAVIALRPVRWNVERGRLELITRARIRVAVDPSGGVTPLPRHRIVPSIEARFERALEPTLATALRPSARGGEGDVAGPGPYQPTFRPTLDGSPVEYVIVTGTDLESEFQRLADFKSRKGVRAVVRTVEWIDQTYPNGVDRAERVRFFVRDAYQNWGTLFLLIGGDTDVVPARYGETTFFNEESIPSDMYYGCLDGNWNADGDGRFGEGIATNEEGDEADFLFEVSVGRAPVSTLEHAQAFVDKTLLYEIDAPSNLDYPASVVVLAERLFDTVHGADIAEQALALLPPWIQVDRYYEESSSYPGSMELSDNAAIAAISSGYGVVHHVGHGFRNTMSMGDGTISNPDADNLTNAPRNSVVFAINCSSASTDFNSIGERFVKNTGGGAVAYIGTSRLAFAASSNLYQNAWYTHLFADSLTSLGIATDMARAALLLGSDNDGSGRWNLMATTLLGDPELDVYTNAVAPLSVQHPSVFDLGDSQILVTVTSGGGPVEGARVTATMDDGSAYETASTSAGGTAFLDFRPEDQGTATITIHKSFYRIYETDIPVNRGNNPYLIALSMTVDDDSNGASNGDGDGQADAGETVELTITLRNHGGTTATGLSVDLADVDPLGVVTIVDGTVEYANLAPGGSSAGLGEYVITIDDTAPTAYQPVFILGISGDQGAWVDWLPLPVRRPHLEHLEHAIVDVTGDGDGVVEAGERIEYSISLRNSGQHRAQSVSASLSVLRASDLAPHPGVTTADAASNFGDITVGNTVSGDPFVFTLGGSTDPATVVLEVTFQDTFGAVRTELLDVIPPQPIDDTLVKAFGSPSSIRLQWDPPSDEDVLGYDIFRADTPGGPFTQLNTYLVEGSAAFEDRELPSLTRFFYEIRTRDTSYNTSPASAVVSGTTNPPLAAGWPIELAQQADSSPVVANLDPGTSELEIFTASDVVYGWHGNGEEIVDGDDDGRTSGPFSMRGYHQSRGFGATTALGDLNQDGELEVVAVGWMVDSVFVWNSAGEMMPGWPQSILDDFNWASPALADIDVNGDLEVVCWAGKGGRLFAWHANGSELVDGDNNPATNGVLFRVFDTSFNYGSPLICNLDPDAQLEIVVPVNFSGGNTGGVYALNPDGSAVPGWPVFTGGPGGASQVSSSPVGADFDDDGMDEVIVSAERQGGTLFVLTHNGSNYPGWPVLATARTTGSRLPSVAVADITGDDELDLVLPGTDGVLRAFHSNGTSIAGFPQTYWTGPEVSETSQVTPTIGDIDGDGEMEIVFGDEGGFVHSYNHDGTLTDGFPLLTGGEVRASPVLWDIDSDNLIEIAVTSFDGSLYMWDMPFDFNPQNVPWPFFRHDTRNTGRVDVAILPDAVLDPGPAAPAARLAIRAVSPNPMGRSTMIVFDLPLAEDQNPVEAAVYDVAGRLVRRLYGGPLPAGRHEIAWDGRRETGAPARSGIYFVRLSRGALSTTSKVSLVR